MGFRRIDLRKLTDKKSIRDYKDLSRRYTWCDKNISFKYLKELGILITSHPGNRSFLRASIETHSKLKLWITLAFDNHFDPAPKATWDSKMPSLDMIDKINCFVMGPRSKWSGVLYPYFWILTLGLGVMKDFEYIYCTNGDCILEKPEGILQLFEELKKKDGDLMSVGYWPNDGKRPMFNSLGFIGRTEAVLAMMKHFKDNFIPLKSYERTCQEFGNCEGRMGRAVIDLGLKVIPVENPKNAQMHESCGTWYNIAGFRHLHAESGFAFKMKGKEPRVYSPELKYVDEKYMNKQNFEFLKNNQPPEQLC